MRGPCYVRFITAILRRLAILFLDFLSPEEFRKLLLSFLLRDVHERKGQPDRCISIL